MTTLYREVARILMSPATSLEGLAAVVDLTVEELFEGERFEGVDLRDEPVEVLLRMDADFSGAILTREQTRALKEKRAAHEQGARLAAATKKQREAFESYIETYVRAERRGAAREAFFDPPLPVGEKPSPRRRSLHLAPSALGFVLAEVDDLLRDPGEAVLRLMILFKGLAIPLHRPVLDVLKSGRVILDPETARRLLDLDLCTDGFVMDWLDGLDPASKDPWISKAYTSRYRTSDELAQQRDLFPDGLRFAVQGRSQLSDQYLGHILGRTRGFSELVDVVADISAEKINMDVAARAARHLALAASTTEEIELIASDSAVDGRVRAMFRRLVVAAGTPEGREALLRIVVKAGEQASGLEVNAILGDLGFEESVVLMRRYWPGLSRHHRNVALDAIAAKASNVAERDRARRLRQQYAAAQ